MKYINQLIRRKIVEITICCIIIIISVPLWNLWPKDTIAYAKTYDNTSFAYVTVSMYQHYQMVPMKDQEALKYLYPMKVTLAKNIIAETHYTLVIRVSKKSNIDLSTLKLSINNQIYFLKERFYKEDDTYNYYLIDEDALKEPEKEYSINIWLDENTTVETQNKNFLYDIINLELNKDLQNI